MTLKQKTSGFIIFGQGRSGSNLLRALLNSHPQVFCDTEIFNPYRTAKKKWLERLKIKYFPFFYINEMMARSGEEVYGFKFFTFHHKSSEYIVKKLYQNGWKIIHIQRKNELKQVFSRLIGLETNRYVRTDEIPPPSETYTLSYKRVINMLKRNETRLAIENKYIAGFDHFPVFYERDLKDKKNWQETTGRIFHFLGLDPVEVSSKNQISDPRPDSERIENFDEIIQYLDENGYESVVEKYYNNL